MLLKSHLGIKYHSHISRSPDSFNTVHPIVTAGDWGYLVCVMETIIVLVLLAFNIIPPKETPLDKLAEVTVHGL